MIKNKKAGFTLIEMMVVIAIIGILSAIVMVQLNSARNKGADANVKSNLANLRSQAEFYYDNNSNSYGTFSVASCPSTASTGVFSDQRVVDAIASAALAGGGNGTRCVATGTTYAISVGLKTAGQSWCVDSAGASKQFAGTPTAAISGGLCS